jgi:leucyl/phenylalanyl-tRNA--protein transferase
MSVFRLGKELIFPSPFLADPDGLLAVGGDLSVERLVLAYRSGVFPWYNEGEPILWWSPSPRLILFPEEFHIGRRFARRLKQKPFEVRFDTDFPGVIARCATVRGPARRGTWITPDMIRAYCRLHEAGYAHSVEAWEGGRLVGGLYGVSLGAAFFGESMFTEVSDASKVALAALVERAKAWGFLFIDCQMRTEHLVRLGAREVSRRAFMTLLDRADQVPTRRGPWRDGGCVQM